MADEETVDEIVHSGGAAPGNGRARGVIEEVIDGGGNIVSRGSRGNRAVEDETIDDVRGARVRRFSDSTEKLLAMLGDGGKGDPDDDGSDDVDDTGDGGDVVDAPAEDAPDDAEAAAPDELATVRADNARLIAANRRLVEASSAPQPRAASAELPARMKRFAEADSKYFDDNIAALRLFIAGVHDLEPDSKEVEEELAGLYTDLTSKEVGVPLSPEVKAARSEAKVRKALARDKKERAAENESRTKQAQPTSEEVDAQKASESATYIHGRLNIKASDDQPSLAERFPLVMALAEDMDGMSPQELLWHVVVRESKAGHFPPNKSDDFYIEAAAKLVEDHYTGIGAKYAAAKNRNQQQQQQNTAKPQGAKRASNEQRREPVARTMSNAKASVAPARPPTAKTKTETEKPKYRSKTEARDALLDRYFPTR